MAGLAGCSQGSLSLTPAPAPWMWVSGLVSGTRGTWDPATEKRAVKPALPQAATASLDAHLRGWGCPCPALQGRGATLHFKGVSLAPQTRWSQGL